MTNNKAREINSPVIEELINETTPQELAKIDTEMTNNKQQTAVEWLWEIAYNRELTIEDWKQAKAMHKEEHFNTWWHSISENEPISFDQSYNETYGGGEQ